MLLSSQLLNESNQFIEYIDLHGYYNAKAFLVQSCSTQNISEWKNEPFQIEKEKNELIRLKLKKPSNALYFHIVINQDYHSAESHISLAPLPAITSEIIRNKLAQSSIAFLCCARNVEEKLMQSLQIISRFGTLFGKHKIYIFENDSTDNTREILFSIKEKYPEIHLIQEEDLVKRMPLRTERLAYARNKLKSLSLTEGFDYYVPSDVDGVISLEDTVSSFISPFVFESAWDACFPLNKYFYYDIWALRVNGYINDDYTNILSNLPGVFKKNSALKIAALQYQHLNQSMLRGWLPVQSAFGGMGIYKHDTFVLGTYIGTAHGKEICEHVSFNFEQTKTGKKHYICPDFTITGLTPEQEYLF